MALTLLLNAVLAYGMYLAAKYYLPQFDQTAAAEILSIADITIVVVEVILIAIAVYFWIENKRIELSVSNKNLHYFDPTFMDYGWTVAIKDIVAIEQYTDVQQHYMNTYVVLRSGDRKQLMYANFPVDRRAFFASLKQVNPTIKFPQNPYMYETKRPKWAQRWLNRKE